MYTEFQGKRFALNCKETNAHFAWFASVVRSAAGTQWPFLLLTHICTYSQESTVAAGGMLDERVCAKYYLMCPLCCFLLCAAILLLLVGALLKSRTQEKTRPKNYRKVKQKVTGMITFLSLASLLSFCKPCWERPLLQTGTSTMLTLSLWAVVGSGVQQWSWGSLLC